MTATDLDDIMALLNGTQIGETGRHRRAAMVWRRVGADAWDVYKPGQCSCGRPQWEGLSHDAAADVLILPLDPAARVVIAPRAVPPARGRLGYCGSVSVAGVGKLADSSRSATGPRQSAGGPGWRSKASARRAARLA